MPLILGAQSAVATGFSIDNACRFVRADETSLEKTPGGAGDARTFTISFWWKSTHLNNTSHISFEAGTAGNKYSGIMIDPQNHVEFTSYNVSAQYRLETTALFVDPGAWFHLVVAFDTTESVEANRIKMYVNGTQITSFSVETYPSLNYDELYINAAVEHGFGAAVAQGTPAESWIDGYLADCAFIDGTAYAASDFGEFNEDSPTIWQPKDITGLTYGSNGALLAFADSANLGDDTSGNGNDWTEVNVAAVNQSDDTPTNNFPTLAVNNPRHADLDITEAGLGLESSNAQWLGCCGTHAVFAGKWYVEAKYITGYNFKLGVVGNSGADVPWLTANSSYAGYSPIGYEYQFNNSATGYKVNNDSSPTWTEGSTTNATGIIMMAFDADNGKIWWGKDGTWFDSSGTADPAAGDDPAFDSIAISANQPWIFSLAIEGTGTNFINFGNPPYANTSDAADGNGYGRFEYEPPSGFLAVCTKNLGSDGG